MNVRLPARFLYKDLTRKWPGKICPLIKDLHLLGCLLIGASTVNIESKARPRERVPFGTDRGYTYQRLEDVRVLLFHAKDDYYLIN